MLNGVNRKRKILIVDDMPNNIRILENFLLKNHYEVYSANDGLSGLKTASEVQPDLILLDIMMPEMDGYEACKCIRENPILNDIPIIFITAKNQQSDILKAFEAGGNDYVVKPFFFQEVLHRIRVHVENKLLREQLFDMSMRDPLTSLWNRRYLIEVADNEIEKAISSEKLMSFAICDIDDFKSVNDKYGHCAGDVILVKVAKIITDTLRNTDYVGRWGGEEFVLLLDGIDKRLAAGFLERIRKGIEETVTKYEDFEIKVTMSFGVADISEIEDNNMKLDSLYHAADERLYAAKNKGKNRIEF